jgi:hypothetical protein
MADKKKDEPGPEDDPPAEEDITEWYKWPHIETFEQLKERLRKKEK